MVEAPAITEIPPRPEFNTVIDIFRQQADKPPGNDLCIGACYKGLLKLFEVDGRIRNFFEEIYSQRPSLTPTHLVNLFFRSAQFIKLYVDKDTTYQSFSTPEEWIPVLSDLINSPNGNTLKELLLNRETITTVYQRYAGPRSLIAALWPDKEVNIADFGCGANYGLRGIELDEPFEDITDETPNQIFTNLLRSSIRLRSSYSVDKQNPEDPETKAWIIACSYYPQELSQIDYRIEMDDRFKKATKNSFLRADLLSPTVAEVIPQAYFDAVILSTILYQQSTIAREAIIAEAKRAAKPDGVVIIQDFARKDPQDPSELAFTEPWFNNDGYRTFLLVPNEEILEAYRWSDGRCHQVKPGEDYDRIFCSK